MRNGNEFTAQEHNVSINVGREFIWMHLNNGVMPTKTTFSEDG